jgi:hypothetical protein
MSKSNDVVAIFAMATALLLLGMLAVSRNTTSKALAVHQFREDSLATQLTEAVLWRDVDAFSAGDTVPALTLVYGTSGITDLRMLTSAYAKYVYFYRNDCPACVVMHSLLDAIPASRSDSIAFIAVHPSLNLVPEQKPHHYALVHDSLFNKKYVFSVPALLVMNDDGRILSTAQGSPYRLQRVMVMYGLLQSSIADSLIRAGLTTLRASESTEGRRNVAAPN